MDTINIKGAKVHNLNNISLSFPKNKLVVFTGVSGSGKSSLAFDTIYAEGQRRYVESLSSYARQFLGIMEKPDVEIIEGLSPAISIDQKTSSHNPRSTVGTVTEIYDYLRLLYARVGHPHCPDCGREVKKMSPQEIADRIISHVNELLDKNKNEPVRFMILSPLVKQRKGEFKDLFDNLRFKGYTRVRIDGYFYNLNEDLYLLKNNKHDIDLVVDRFSINHKYLKEELNKKEFNTRIYKSVEQSTTLSDGLVVFLLVKDSNFNISDSPTKTTEELYSENFSCPFCHVSFTEIEPRLFSFNSPVGACNKCKGLGVVMAVDQQKVMNQSLSIAEGALFPFQKIFFLDTWFARLFRVFLKKNQIDENTPLVNLSKDQVNKLLYGTNEVYSVRGKNRDNELTTIYEKWHGLVSEVEKKYYESNSDYSRGDLQKYMNEETCPECSGDKLNSKALGVVISGLNIANFTKKSIKEEIIFIKDLPKSLTDRENEIARTILKEISTRLEFLDKVGLGYLSLERRANTLSGGEAQRIRLASQIGTGLTGITYVLDEPSIGLHSKDVNRLISALDRMRDLQNTVIVVEHDYETIRSADWLVDFGKYAGKNGGNIIYNGEYRGILNCKESLTGAFLKKNKKVITKRNNELPANYIEFNNCNKHNLKNINVKIPYNRISAITGVSGSGKSTLLLETIYPSLKALTENKVGYYKKQSQNVAGGAMIQRTVLIDQSPIGRTPRSNPATYTGVFTDIRDVYASTVDAKAQGFNAGRFSFNVKGGRCENCKGAGVIKVEMQFLADVYVKCDVCVGKRYNLETLSIKYKNKTINEVLDMTVDEAAEFFVNHWKITRTLRILQSVGLGYIELGQSAPTLSGGEAQRVKLAKELYTNINSHTIYLLDEPTTGLHMYDVNKLVKVLRNLVEQGNTVVVIEHNLDIIKNSDYIIDLGKEGGEKGGEVIYQGNIEGLLNETDSDTAHYLKEYLDEGY